MTKDQKAAKALDKAISAAWARLASGVQVDIMDIPQIFKNVRLDVSRGIAMDNAIQACIANYRKN